MHTVNKMTSNHHEYGETIYNSKFMGYSKMGREIEIMDNDSDILLSMTKPAL